MQTARLHRRLSSTPGYACRVLDIGASRRRRRPECLPSRHPLELAARLLGHALRGDIIHLHTNGHTPESWLLSFACACAGFLNGRKTVISFGSGLAPEFLSAARRPTRLFVRAVAGLVGAIICRNERTRQALLAVGARPDKITILSGFYGVDTDELPEVPPEVAAFHERHSPVALALDSRGPWYGIPLLLEAVARLRSRYPRFGLLLIGSGTSGMPVDASHVLPTGELPHDVVLSVMRSVSVFVRPTICDGDSLSVREALALRVPVVASDTDFRPEGVILFRRGDIDDLVTALTRALQPPAGSAHAGADGDAFDRLLAVYERLAPVGRETA